MGAAAGGTLSEELGEIPTGCHPDFDENRRWFRGSSGEVQLQRCGEKPEGFQRCGKNLKEFRRCGKNSKIPMTL